MEFLIVAIVVGSIFYSLHHDDRAWKAVAEDLDFVYTSPMLGSKVLNGHLRGFDVRIAPVSDSNRGKKLVIEISGVDSGFTLGRDSAFKRMIKPDIETGDQIFDERTRIEGDPDWALALLGEDARRLTEIVISGWNGELDGGGTLSAPCKKIGSAPSMLDTLLDLAQLLRRPDHAELPRLLVERVSHDASSAVRLQAFRRLASSAFAKEAQAVAETMLGSPSAVLRLEASGLLLRSGPEHGERAVEELSALATGQQIDSSVRRSALETLTESRHGASAVPVMRRILRQSDASVVRTAALEGLIRVGAKAELLEIQAEDTAEAEILARGLGFFDTSVQPKLLQLLENSEDRVRWAAARSLGQVGDLDAIRPLREVVGRGRLLKSALAREAERAIDNIKSRSNASQQGEVSIIAAAPLEGAISPSDVSDAGGEVSLT